MSKGIKAIGAATGLYTPKVPGVGGISLDPKSFDISAEVDPAKQRLATLREQSAADVAAANPARSQALEQMGQAALGQGPSIAEEQMKQAQTRSLAQQVAAAQSGRGTGTMGATQRQLAQQLASSGQQIASDAGQARLAEQNQARNAFIATTADDRNNQSELIRQQLELDTAAKRTMQDFERARSGAAAQQSSLMNANQQASASRLGGVISGGMQAAAMMSDKNEKKGIKSSDKKVDSFLDALKAKEYKYKNPIESGASEGKKAGIMAQDMEKSEIGKNIVKQVNGKKMISIPDSVSAVLAAQARLNDRLNKLENKKKKA